MRHELNRPYSAPSPADCTPLATLIRAVGDLKVTGYTATQTELRHSWNTDRESLKRLEDNAHDARYVIGCGLSGIGNLLTIAAGNEDHGEIDSETLRNTGALIQYLADSLIPLSELEYSLGRSEGIPGSEGGGQPA